MFTPLAIPDVILIQPARHVDSRGWFSETFNSLVLNRRDFPTFVQDNESMSVAAGTVRGLHFQLAPFAQAKLVRCVRGALVDIALDIRVDSVTYGQYVSTRLDPDTGHQVFMPAGFAHGFCTLEPNTLIQYKVSAPYAPDHQGGIAWDDPALGIDWPVNQADAKLSERDRTHPRLADLSRST